MDIFLLDSSNNTQEEANIIRPKNYQKLLEQLNKKLNLWDIGYLSYLVPAL